MKRNSLLLILVGAICIPFCFSQEITLYQKSDTTVTSTVNVTETKDSVTTTTCVLSTTTCTGTGSVSCTSGTDSECNSETKKK